MAILLITHDWGVVADIADRAVVIYAGEVVEQSDVDSLFHAPRVGENLSGKSTIHWQLLR